MITTKTPGAYSTRIDKGRHKGYAKRITKERVLELRAQGKPWAEIAGILGVSMAMLHIKWYEWREEGV